MQGLNSELSKAVRDQQQADLLQYMRFREGDDAELVLQALNLVLDVAGKKFSDMFSESYVKLSLGKQQTIRFDSFIKLCSSLVTTIKETIFNVYQFRPKSLALYSELMSTLAEISKQTVHYVYTTNYDRVVEEFCANTQGFQVVDGFAIDPRSRRSLWNPRVFEQPTSEEAGTVKLFKLHGSLNWLQSQFGIEQVMTERILQEPTPVYKKNLLIYPGTKTPPEEEPFKTLYERFETHMRQTDRCLVIGFSFRDPYLNRVFRDFVRSGKGQLLVMSSNCNRTVASLLGIDEDGLSSYIGGNNFVPIPCHFGDETWRERLGNAIKSIPIPIESPQ
jgi:hypothetical protein